MSKNFSNTGQCRSSMPGDFELCWGCGELTFSFSTPDRSLFDKASAVLAPWSKSLAAEAIHSWRAAPIHGDAPTWELRGESTVSTHHSHADVVLAVEYGAVRRSAECVRQLSLHAALVANGSRAMVIVGPCEAGKSTLACGLWKAGWSLLSDDGVCIESDGSMGRPFPRRISLRYSSREIVGEECWSRLLQSPAGDRSPKGIVFHAHEVDGRPRVDSARIVAILFLARSGAPTGPSGLTRLEPAHALMSLLPYSNLARRLDTHDAIGRLEPIANAVPAFDLARDDLSAMVQQVEDLIAKLSM